MQASYIDHMGSDDRVVDSARVSFSKEASHYSEDQNGKLIRFLANHGHFTPFTHPQITMRETVPIFVARQRFKHTIGFSYNEVSRRYVDDEPEFFIPEVWRSRPEGSVKQGSGDAHGKSDTIGVAYEEFTNICRAMYEELIQQGVAPEQARMVLPQSMLTSYYVTGSLAAWARAYTLRVDAHAQVEIQDLAHQWGEVIEPLFPISWRALTT